jgi:probable rRNA maturation factor
LFSFNKLFKRIHQLYKIGTYYRLPFMPSQILFYKSGVKFRFSNKAQITKWIGQVIRKEGKQLGSIQFIFCTDDFLLEINNQYLKHDYYTDIITFNYSEGNRIVGEIYISLDRVKDNAVSIGIMFPVELQRVIIHGILHLLGYKDKNAAQKKLMRKKEDACLSLLPQ